MKSMYLFLFLIFPFTGVQASDENAVLKQLEEQREVYKSPAEDEAEYYRAIEPHRMDDPTYLEKDHPLQEKPLEEKMIQ